MPDQAGSTVSMPPRADAAILERRAVSVTALGIEQSSATLSDVIGISQLPSADGETTWIPVATRQGDIVDCACRGPLTRGDHVRAADGGFAERFDSMDTSRSVWGVYVGEPVEAAAEVEGPVLLQAHSAEGPKPPPAQRVWSTHGEEWAQEHEAWAHA